MGGGVGNFLGLVSQKMKCGDPVFVNGRNRMHNGELSRLSEGIGMG